MKNSTVKKALFIIFAAVLARGGFALDITVSGGAGNLAFDPERVSFLSGENNPGEFTPDYFPLALVAVSGKSGGIAYNAGYERDPLLRNRLFGNVTADLEYALIEAGPLISFFNSRGLPVTPGVSAGLTLQLPGTAFVRGAGSSTLAFIRMDKEGRYFHYSGDVSAGFWVPYVICSLNMSLRNFSVQESEALLIEDELVRYFFTADVYTKNVPYAVKVNLGYQSLRRSYTAQAVSGGAVKKETTTDEYKSLFAGFEGTYTFSPRLKFLLAGEMPVYSWGVRPMKDPPKGTMLFQAKAGVVWTIE